MLGTSAERGKPVMLLLQAGREIARWPESVAGRGGGSKRRLAGNRPDRGGPLPSHERGPLPSGLLAREPLTNRLRRQSR